MAQDTNNIPELQSPFEQLREVDADGKEWWNSRKLARVMGIVFVRIVKQSMILTNSAIQKCQLIISKYGDK